MCVSRLRFRARLFADTSVLVIVSGIGWRCGVCVCVLMLSGVKADTSGWNFMGNLIALVQYCVCWEDILARLLFCDVNKPR